MANELNGIKEYSIKINDYNPHAFCLIRVELDEAGKPCDWTFLYCNDALAKLEGLPKEKLVGHRFFELFPNGSRKWLKPYYEAAYEGKASSCNDISEEIDKYLQIESFPTDEKGVCVCILRDIKKETVEKEQRSKELQQTVEKLGEEKRINAQVQQYASAMGIVYPLAISIDYLNNEYHMLEYEQFLNKTAKWSGTVDELIEVGASTIPEEEYAEKFKALFGRKKALEAFRGGEKELTLKHPQWGDDGKVHWMETKVICLACTETKAEAISVSRCIDEEKQIEDAKEKLQERDFILTALSADYDEVYFCNIDADTLRVIKSGDLQVVNSEGKYSEIGRFFFKDKVLVESAPDMLEKLSRKGLKNYLISHKEMSIRYELKADERGRRFCETRFVHVPSDTGFFVVIGTHFIDEIVNEQQQKKAELEDLNEKLEEQLAIIDTLSRSFRNVFVANLKNGKARAIRLADSYKVKAVRDIEGIDFDFDAVVDRWTRETVHPDDKDRMKATLSIQNLKKVLSEQEEFIGNYRNIEDGVVHHYQYDFRQIGDTGNVVAGFRIIDSLIEEQEAKQKREKELIEAEQKRLQTINAIGQAYSSIYVAYLDTKEIETVKGVGQEDHFRKISALSNAQKLEHMKRYVAEPYLKGDIEFTDLNTVAERLAGQQSLSYIFQKTDGSWMQSLIVPQRYDRDGKVDMILLANRDVTEEKNKELSQQETLKNQLGIIESLSNEYNTLYLVDTETKGWSIFKTAGTEPIKNIIDQLSVYENYEVAIGKYIENYVAAENREELTKNTKIENLIAETPDKGVYSMLYDRVFKEGRQHWQINAAKFTTDEGKVYIVMGFRDVHEVVEKQERQNEQLAHALAMAQQANKAKTTFLNSMSHDIRTPMNAIVGFTALAKTHIDEKEQVRDYLSKINTSSTHLLSLINDILDMSRIESGTVKLEEKAVHLPDLMHDLRTMIQGQVNAKNQNLFIDTQDIVHEDVLTDKLRLNQVLLNIVGNAIKFTQPGGDIIIHLIEKPCSLKQYTTYEFSVKDTGIGMSQEFIGHIFETFTRERSSTVSGIQGTGLGMAITKNIVDMMGGEIEVESKVGKGSRFTVTLNLRLADEPIRYLPIPELLGARALIVDDDMDTCRNVSKMLYEIEMRPDWTTSGKEAVVRAQDAVERKDEYKVYIIDYLMPDMNGIETIRRIRKVISEDVPIIVLTAYDWTDFEKEAREAGVTAFVSKPIFMSELRAVLTQPVIKEGIEKEKEKEKTYDYSDKHVLLVEDNELNREIATAILEETGMKLDSVCDGDEAVAAIVNAPADRYDLIFMDIQMPKMNGYMATREIRTLADNKKANIPIVAMTANAFEEDKRKAFEAGMDGHIIKPISMEAIAKVLDEIFAEKR